MGSRIAAHLANAGIPSVLLDLSVDAARKGIETAAKQRPTAFYVDAAKALITPGSFDEHLASIAHCDWIIEAVTEKLEVKRAIWQRVAAVRRPGTVVSTNTSGIPLASICDGFPEEFRTHFLGTHFFNPPRYLHLVEVIPGPATDPAVMQSIGDFCDVRLGKGVVPCKDTPNFIANRIGSFYGSTVYKLTVEGDYTVEEVDALTGPLIGVPKTASFRLLDVVGLDVWAFVSQNLYDLVPDDPWRERFLPPAFLARMLDRGWLGEKSGQGFYKRVGPKKEIWAIDWKTLEYHPAETVTFPSLDAAKRIEDLPNRLRFLVSANDRAGSLLWKLFSDVFLYSAERIPEIADRVVEIDRAMRWGYAQTFGPFELWDALGFVDICDRIEREGRALPENILRMRKSGATSFYRHADANCVPITEYFDLGTSYRELEPRPGVLSLRDMKRARGVVHSSPEASLVDLGDGVLCCEFHSKANALADEALSMLLAGLEETDRNFEALVIANDGENFSAGANLALLLSFTENAEWNKADTAIRRFQECNMALKYSSKPVVAAPFARVLGGGAEVALHASRMQASAELYMGLPEVSVGLVPAGGGCKELLIRLKDPRRVFELIGAAKVSASAPDAQNLGFLHKADRISMNRERLLHDAKALALSMVTTHAPGAPRTDIPVGGEAAYAAMKLAAWSMKEGGFISEHDFVIAEKLTYVLSGGRTLAATLSEQHLLDLEREAFLSLCGQKRTHDRIEYTLKTGQPLRN
jgi:3-hydroxyacyl-CoA dehydrogenase